MAPDLPADPTADAAPSGLEIRGAAVASLDDPLLLRARGGGPDEPLVWRGRLRDDDGRVWRATAERAEELCSRWVPSKAPVGPVPALLSLRPVSIDIRVEAADGRTATRTLTRTLLGDGVLVRRWRDGVAATLFRPVDAEPRASVVLDATAGATAAVVAGLAAPLLASRGILVLTVGAGRGTPPDGDALRAAADRLAAVPGAPSDVLILATDRATAPSEEDATGAPTVVVPPGIAAGDSVGGALDRARLWDALLEHLGARPRATR